MSSGGFPAHAQAAAAHNAHAGGQQGNAKSGSGGGKK